MTDIVERLRGEQKRNLALMLEAADEIERLRAAKKRALQIAYEHAKESK